MNLAGVASGLPSVPPTADAPRLVGEVDRLATLTRAAVGQSQVSRLVENILPEGAQTLAPPSEGHSLTTAHMVNCAHCLMAFYSRSAYVPSRPSFVFYA